MSATATVLQIWCVRQATGTDAGANQALAGLATSIPFDELAGQSLQDAVKALPGVVAAMDEARSDPDNLYVTTVTSGGVENRIWPTDADTRDMQAGQSEAPPSLSVDVSFSQNVSLWDYDSVSDDDLLGSVTVLESEQGSGQVSKLAKSDVEGSYYYVTYQVD